MMNAVMSFRIGPHAMQLGYPEERLSKYTQGCELDCFMLGVDVAFS